MPRQASSQNEFEKEVRRYVMTSFYLSEQFIAKKRTIFLFFDINCSKTPPVFSVYQGINVHKLSMSYLCPYAPAAQR